MYVRYIEINRTNNATEAMFQLRRFELKWVHNISFHLLTTHPRSQGSDTSMLVSPGVEGLILCILVCVETNVNELSSFSLKQDCKAMHLQTFA